MGNSGKGKTCKGNSKRKPNTNIEEKRPLKGPERETTEQSAQRISNKLDFKVAPNDVTTRGFVKYCAAKMRRRQGLSRFHRSGPGGLFGENMRKMKNFHVRDVPDEVREAKNRGFSLENPSKSRFSKKLSRFSGVNNMKK